MDNTPDQANILLIIILVPRILVSIVLTIVVIDRGRGALLRHRDVSWPLSTHTCQWRCLKIEEIGH